ncbi:MAG: adenylyltransferase/cytidyltransferase family protein [Bacteroidaceae bacterium]|jgi:glycerol-3-phosphate cytidylyltransferase|nr:adenylyltransferase/cytidyltransferase family protein [Bacteroidaceae bacterium]MBQ1665754.1 adenylyltransferase/cytidyltransferase family protein [Bacteroidaceae bacterium]MBQ2181942.1 adenylyltransferase/cytidyltransferase family protein [Bacteroidaceae bacterium]MBQ2200116.1 adenylyltransferase/cytidyltransferase family protein [Bacteroidaceae bacterium]MBQ5461358.1 adenylyltransferase/cytidyltransferase family protein [Bacteroidaceae bacterium]
MKRVFTSGSFDLFHVGHLNILEKSAALGDELIVGVSTDELIEKYKGMKPIIPFEQRFRIVQSIKCVTKVVKQVKLTEIAQLQREKIDIVTIGDDWVDKYLEGLEWMKQQPGKEVVYFPYTPGVSTTIIKRQIIESANQIVYAALHREELKDKDWDEDPHV